MEQKQIESAVIAVLQDPKLVAEFASKVAKAIVREKSNPDNIEEALVKNHVIFAEKGSATGKWMTVKEISEEILGFNDDIDIRPRIFGKALMVDVKDTKDSNAGRVYFIEAVVEEITADLIDSFGKAPAESVEDKKDAAEEAATISLSEQLDGMGLTELLEIYHSLPIEIKKYKKLDADELRKKMKKKLSELESSSEKEAEVIPETVTETATVEEKPKVNVALLIQAVSDYEELSDYKDHLSSMSKGKLIKHINNYEMPIICEDKTEEEIVEAIVSLIEENMEAPTDEPERPTFPENRDEKANSSGKTVVIKKKDKDKDSDKKEKKSKKDKKKKKKNKE